MSTFAWIAATPFIVSTVVLGFFVFCAWNGERLARKLQCTDHEPTVSELRRLGL